MPQAHLESRWRRALPLGALTTAVGFGAGLLITAVTGAIASEFLLWLPLLFGGLVGLAGYLIGVLVVEGGADLASRILAGGGSAGTKREYSYAQALAVRGDYAGALRAYRAAADEHPRDAEPLIQGARILRDSLADPERASEWLQQAAAIPDLPAAHELTIAQELVELYDGPLDRPERAIPELARVASRYPETRAGDWARRRLVELRVRVRHDISDPYRPIS